MPTSDIYETISSFSKNRELMILRNVKTKFQEKHSERKEKNQFQKFASSIWIW